MAASFRLNFTQTIRFSVGTIRQKTTNVGLKKKWSSPVFKTTFISISAWKKCIHLAEKYYLQGILNSLKPTNVTNARTTNSEFFKFTNSVQHSVCVFHIQRATFSQNVLTSLHF